jgi:LPS export ABC transporter protein LptC
MRQHGYGTDKRLHIIQNLIIAALVTGAAMLFTGCVNDIEKIKAFNPSEILPVVQAENFESTMTDSGIVRFFLKTPELNRYESEEGPFAEFPKGILLIKYGPQMEVLSSISARYAKQFVREKRWEARNDVVAINSTGDTLKTEHLIWDEPGKRIYNNEFVQIIRTDQIITGVGFESDASLENWRIKNPKGTIYVQLNREGVAPGDSLGSGDSLRPMNFGNE